MFFKRHNGDPPTVEYIKIALQHTIVFLLMTLCVYFWQQETFWGVKNLKQSVCFYSILVLFAFTIPVFTLGETVSSNSRQTFLMSVTCFCYIQIFPPPLIHGLIGSYLTITHYLYRTHAFTVFASPEQKYMAHSAAECTICAIKGATLVSVMIYFRI
jgi:hypothetical protein